MNIDDIKALAALGATEVTIHPDGRIVAKFEKPAAVQVPISIPSVWISPNTTAPPFPPPSFTITTLSDLEPCLLDGLPPGPVWISCPCRKCSPQSLGAMAMLATADQWAVPS